jgi:hypothetical protein
MAETSQNLRMSAAVVVEKSVIFRRKGVSLHKLQ